MTITAMNRYLAELDRCKERYDDYAHPHFWAACNERAAIRRDLCNRNGGRPSLNEPHEWDERDEKIWFDTNR